MSADPTPPPPSSTGRDAEELAREVVRDGILALRHSWRIARRLGGVALREAERIRQRIEAEAARRRTNPPPPRPPNA